MIKRTAKAVIAHRAFQFVSRSLGACHRQVGKSGKAVGVILHRTGKRVVDVARKRNAFAAFDQIGTRASDRQNVHRDAGLIHVGDPSRAKFGQLFFERGAETRRKSSARNCLRVDAVHKRRDGEMLFERDHAHRLPPVV